MTEGTNRYSDNTDSWGSRQQGSGTPAPRGRRHPARTARLVVGASSLAATFGIVGGMAIESHRLATTSAAGTSSQTTSTTAGTTAPVTHTVTSASGVTTTVSGSSSGVAAGTPSATSQVTTRAS